MRAFPPGCQRHTGIVLRNNACNMRQRFLKLVFYPIHEHLLLPLTFQNSTHRNICHGLLPSSLPLLISLTVTWCDLVRMRKDRRTRRRFQGAWDRRSHGVAIPGDGSMMQDQEQHKHQPYLGCYQGHEQCWWTLLSTDLLCFSTSGPTQCPHSSDCWMPFPAKRTSVRSLIPTCERPPS